MEQDTLARPTSARVAQKRAQVRARLINAADRLTRARSVDDVSIKDITEEADVGQGTFYIHFKSKNDVLVPIMEADASRLDAAMQSVLQDDDSPAQIIGMSARIMGRYVTSNDRWRWVLENSSVPVEVLQRAFGQFGRRDYQKGRLTGEFIDIDPTIVAGFAFGGMLNVLVMSLRSPQPERIIDLAVELSLRTLGVAPEKAAQIAHQDLLRVQLPYGNTPGR